MTMDVEMNPRVADENDTEQDMIVDEKLHSIINHLIDNPDIVFKSQQRGEADLTNQEKSRVALNVFQTNKSNFLSRFGKYLSLKHLDYFEQFVNNSEEVRIILRELQQIKHSYTKNVKNRRYEALLEMVQEGSYFSDVEMMKRNPLLYEQLVGKYLTDEEKKARDKEKMYQEQTFVRILMEGIERDNAEIKRQKQEEYEEEIMEDEENSSSSDVDEEMRSEASTPEPTHSRWGEYDEDKEIQEAIMNKPKKPVQKITPITAEEKQLLKEEFVTSMYQSFLDGKDEDFDYDSVDNNEKYDNKDIAEHDAENKYFDSEEPEDVADEDVNQVEESSEDELDIYMSALNQHPSVLQLTNNMKNL